MAENGLSIANIVKLGPAGDSEGGTEFDHKGSNKLVQIFISHGEKINSIQFQYADNNNDGSLRISEQLRSIRRNHFNVVKLNYPDEYITWIKGHYKYSYGRICSIEFERNRRKYGYGPYGRYNSDNDEDFLFSLGDDNQFFGFHGTADSNGLKSIGVYFKPVTTLDDGNKPDAKQRVRATVMTKKKKNINKECYVKNDVEMISL